MLKVVAGYLNKITQLELPHFTGRKSYNGVLEESNHRNGCYRRTEVDPILRTG